MMQKAITMTSKGTFTLPAKVRKALGVTHAGDQLLLQYHEKSRQIIIEKPADLKALQQSNAALIKASGIQPLKDVNAVRDKMHAERWRRFAEQDD